MSDFVHLSVHSEYSVVDSVVFLKALPPAIKQQGMSTVALTDKSNLIAMLKFQNACFDAGIKPIFGCDLNMHRPSCESRLLVLAANQVGYHNMIRLVTESSVNKSNRNCVESERLAELNEGLIVLSGGVSGDIGQRLLSGDVEGAGTLLDWYIRHFGDRFYAEVSRTGRLNENEYIEAIVPLVERKGVPLVATNDVVIVAEEDSRLHDAKLCIQRHERLDDAYSWKGQFSPRQYVRSPAEMSALFKDLPDAIENTVEIAKRCNVEVETGTYFQRPFPTSNESENASCLREKVATALDEFLTDEHGEIAAESHDAYRDRAKYELDVIIDMGFASYFLIVQEIVEWARSESIPVGPGRGSGAASLVAMLLGITGLDPIKHKLFFERLLNRDRRSMPDLDIDFCAERRDKVMWHVVERFGRDCVGLIGTQGTHAAKSIIHGMARAFGYSFSEVSRITNLIPTRPGIKLDQACKDNPAIEEVAAAYGCSDLLTEARKLEGIVATTGIHPAGVVIAPDRLEEFVPCHIDADSELLVTQLDKDDVEKAGMVKFDLLSLKNLTVIDRTVKAINETRHDGSSRFSIDDIPLDDAQTFRVIAAADTEGVFQLESDGMKRVIRQLKPDQFTDLVALVALYRPGPLNASIDKSYALRKHGQQRISYDHPLLEPVLKDNYGLMIYQEDVMAVSRTLAGFSGGEADILREAMGKKRIEKLNQLKDRFLEGCEHNGVDTRVAVSIFDQMRGFSEYAFPRAHATAYAVVTYQTAYLKARYPNDYMAAAISVERGDPKRVVRLLTETERLGLLIEPPDVNQPSADCVATADGLRLGLLCLKGVGTEDVRTIDTARHDGEFRNLFDFCMRVDLSSLSRNAVESMIKIGALDGVETQFETADQIRAVLHDKLDRAYRAGAEANDSSIGLFGGPQEREVFGNYRAPKPLSNSQLCNDELSVLGVALSRESNQKYFQEFRPICTHDLDEVHGAKRKTDVVVAGVVTQVDVRDLPRRGEIANIVLQGPKGTLRTVLWPENYREYSKYVLDDQFVIVKGQVGFDKFRNEVQLSVNEVFDVEKGRQHWHSFLKLQFINDEDRSLLSPENLEKLQQLFRRTKRTNGRKVEIVVRKRNAELKVDLGEGYKQLPVTDEILTELRGIFGLAVVNVGFQNRVE